MRVVKKPEERKAEMVAAASKLFAQQGFVRTSVAEIVTAVDVAKGLFYYYFTTKDDMVKAVVEGYCSYLGSEMLKIAGMDISVSQKMRRIMDHSAWNACFTEPLIKDLCMPQHAALYSDMCDRLVSHLRPAVESIVAEALHERGEDVSQAGMLAGVGMYGVLMMARRGEMTMESAAAMFERMSGLSRCAS
ncbi:MAG: TetR/AcrR family transcriptional regulator [Clostridia bacterium]|nr:TetR/AcrR family transcriptional regulator [Clostridia bacterium]